VAIAGEDKQKQGQAQLARIHGAVGRTILIGQRRADAMDVAPCRSV